MEGPTAAPSDLWLFFPLLFFLSSPGFGLLFPFFSFFFSLVRSLVLPFFFFFHWFGLQFFLLFFFLFFFLFLSLGLGFWVSFFFFSFFFTGFGEFGFFSFSFFFSLGLVSLGIGGWREKKKEKKVKAAQGTGMGPTNSWKILSDDKWVMVPNGVECFKWWVMSDKNWVMSDEWWVMKTEWWMTLFFSAVWNFSHSQFVFGHVSEVARKDVDFQHRSWKNKSFQYHFASSFAVYTCLSCVILQNLLLFIGGLVQYMQRCIRWSNVELWTLMQTRLVSRFHWL